MKNPLLLPLALIAASLGWETTQAATVFDENFDQSPYADQSIIRFGYKWIHYGQWVAPPSSSSRGIATSEKSLSGPMSLKMERATDKSNVRVRGEFGETNEASIVVTEALQFRFAINVTNNAINTFFFAIRGPSDGEFAKVTLQNGTLNAVFNATSRSLGAIQSDTWYYVEFILPENPGGSNNQYTVRLYGEDGTSMQGEQTGTFSQSAAIGGYSYFYTGHDTLNQTVFLDNITAVTIPEGSTKGYILIGLGGLAAASFQRRKGRVLA